MKPLLLFSAITLLFASCSNKLSRRDAFNLLEKRYPIDLYYQVFTVDPNHAQKMKAEGLVTKGFVTIDSNAGFDDRKIFFNEKAKDLLLPTPDEEKAREIQRVKTGEYHLLEVTDLKASENKAAVEYTYEIRNLTPFSKLHNKPIKEKEQRKNVAYFI